MDLWFILLSCISLISFLYFYVQQKYSYWSKRGIPGPKPSLMSFGNTGTMSSQDPYKLEQDFRTKYGKVYGNYQGFKPVIAIADPELIKQVMVKDFHLFADQQELHVTHPIASRIVFLESGPNWKRLRTITTACVSSGKLRLMFGQMGQSVDQLSGYLERLVQSENGIIKDLKQIMVGFTLDVIGSNVFGVQTNSNSDYGRDLSNPFMVNALKIFNVPSYKLLAILALPGWFNYFVGIRKPFNDEAWEFFEQLAREILRQRRASKQAGIRNDLIEILLNARVDESKFENTTSYEMLDANLDQEEEHAEAHSSVRSNKAVLSEDEIMAQAIGFMVGGYDSVAVVLTACVYELAINPAVQDRLHDELEQKLSHKRSNSSEYNETVMQIPYLDAVLKETLRKYPPFTRIGRRFGGSTQPYKLGHTGVVLQKNQLVEFPTLAVHYDPEYFPEPNSFMPYRFMPENKDKLVPYSFIPYGQGPRNCIGLRFATQEMKLCLAKICRQFRFVPTDQTPACPIPFLPFKGTLTLAQIEVKVEKH